MVTLIQTSSSNLRGGALELNTNCTMGFIGLIYLVGCSFFSNLIILDSEISYLLSTLFTYILRQSLHAGSKMQNLRITEFRGLYLSM